MPSMFNPATLMPAFDDVAPQEAYKQLGECPYTRPDGMKVLAKRDDIVEFNRHPAVRANDGVHWSMGATAPLLPLDVDGLEQKRIRRLLDPLFSPKAIAPLIPAVRALTNELIDDFVDKGQVELFQALCQALPSRIFVNLLGLPQSDLPVFEKFKDAVVRPEGDTLAERKEYSERAGDTIRHYLDAVFDSRDAEEGQRQDLIDGLMNCEIDGERLTRTEIRSIIYLLIIAGLDTVVSSLSCIFSWFARNLSEQDRVVADPALIPAAVEELMRFESPVMQGFRFVTEPFTINEWSFDAGDEVAVMWASANVDPDVFENPLTVDLGRRRNPHIDFATGPHRCLGSNFARMELAVVIEEFHKRIPHYWITEGDAPTYVNIGVRAAHHLPISFTAAKGS